MHPYRNLPQSSFWTKSVSDVLWNDVFKNHMGKFRISNTENVCTIGSCFAQRISTFLRESGFRFLDVEPVHPMVSTDEAKRLGYGIYSARYGNIYSTRQLKQLMEESLGVRSQINKFERLKTGKIKDLLRPGVHGDGFETIEEAEADRAYHLSRVKQMWSQLDVFIFTLGLTEAWVDTDSNIVYGIHPSVATSGESRETPEKINLDYNDCLSDLNSCFHLLRSINKKAKIVLTVSPVGLAATHQDNHVLLANCYSKSILRAVAGKLHSMNDFIEYFMSYELISAAQSFGQFLSTDLRDVNNRGVILAMSAFKNIFLDENEMQTSLHQNLDTGKDEFSDDKEYDAEVQCDEIYNSIFRGRV